jgi:phosphoglycerate dehydrogenase-like enzyme
MTIYVDPKLLGRKNFQKLETQFPTVNIVTDVTHPKDIEALITMPKIVKEMNLDDYPKLRWIQYLMAGYDGLDLEEFRNKGIDFCNAQNIFSKSIAEDVFTKIFYFNRNVKHYIDSKKEKKWEPIREELELTKSTVLILGVGSIGRELAKRFKAFEAYVIGYRSRDIPEENFDEIIVEEENLNMAIQRADYVILALPLTEKTTHMFDEEKFDIMKSTALLINVARGKVVNQRDLINALKENKIRGAGLDVFDPEPLPETNLMWELDNVYITPHNASSSPYMRDRLYEMTVMNLRLFIQGEAVKYILN